MQFICRGVCMNKIAYYLRGYNRVHLSGAEFSLFLNNMVKDRIPFWNLERNGPFDLSISIFCRDLDQTTDNIDRSMCEFHYVEKIGFGDTVKGLLHRKLFLVGLSVIILFFLVFPQFVFFYEVNGNMEISDEQILQTLYEIGIHEGIYGPRLKPKWIKDHVLNVLPELQWITITQNGCKAKVVVRERPDTPEITNRKDLTNIVAAHGGLITDISVLEGQAVCKPGDIVSKGDLLVSGLVDAGRVYRLVHAQAEIFARTWKRNVLVTPRISRIKQIVEAEEMTLWLELGKQRIKIFGNSGIMDTSCDKIINKEFLPLPGKLHLPFAVVTERCFLREMQDAELSTDYVQNLLQTRLRNQIIHSMRSGIISSERFLFEKDLDVYILEGIFECHEMIAEAAEANWNEKEEAYD